MILILILISRKQYFLENFTLRLLTWKYEEKQRLLQFDVKGICQTKNTPHIQLHKAFTSVYHVSRKQQCESKRINSPVSLDWYIWIYAGKLGIAIRNIFQVPISSLANSAERLIMNQHRVRHPFCQSLIFACFIYFS